MSAHTTYRALALAMSLMLAGMGAALAAPAQTQKGPTVKVAEETFEEETKPEDRLHRLGDMGKMHFFGYGELHLNNKIGPTTNEIDFHRLVLGFGYDFTDKINFRAELDFEHAFKEPELEYAYLDFLVRQWANIRAGAIMVPMGVINEHHEPPLFLSVERPELYRVLIPTSWQEGGAGVYGTFGEGFDYQLYFLSTPDASGFTGSNGIRGGRGGVGEQVARDFGGSGRIQYTGTPGLRLGTSAFVGNTGQGNDAIGGALLTMLEADAKYSIEGIDLEGIIALNSLSDAGALNTALVAANPAFTNFVGSKMLGWYLEGAYHLFHHLLPNTKHDLVAFTRFEKFNTQYKMPTGFASNGANDRNTLTVGASYLPIPQVAVKADYMFNWNKANSGVDQFNLGIGFYY